MDETLPSSRRTSSSTSTALSLLESCVQPSQLQLLLQNFPLDDAMTAREATIGGGYQQPWPLHQLQPPGASYPLGGTSYPMPVGSTGSAAGGSPLDHICPPSTFIPPAWYMSPTYPFCGPMQHSAPMHTAGIGMAGTERTMMPQQIRLRLAQLRAATEQWMQQQLQPRMQQLQTQLMHSFVRTEQLLQDMYGLQQMQPLPQQQQHQPLPVPPLALLPSPPPISTASPSTSENDSPSIARVLKEFLQPAESSESLLHGSSQLPQQQPQPARTPLAPHSTPICEDRNPSLETVLSTPMPWLPPASPWLPQADTLPRSGGSTLPAAPAAAAAAAEPKRSFMLHPAAPEPPPTPPPPPQKRKQKAQATDKKRRRVQKSPDFSFEHLKDDDSEDEDSRDSPTEVQQTKRKRKQRATIRGERMSSESPEAEEGKDEKTMREWMEQDKTGVCLYGCSSKSARSMSKPATRRLHLKTCHYDIYFVHCVRRRTQLQILRECTLGAVKGPRTCLHCHQVTVHTQQDMREHLEESHPEEFEKFAAEEKRAEEGEESEEEKE